MIKMVKHLYLGYSCH